MRRELPRVWPYRSPVPARGPRPRSPAAAAAADRFRPKPILFQGAPHPAGTPDHHPLDVDLSSFVAGSTGFARLERLASLAAAARAAAAADGSPATAAHARRAAAALLAASGPHFSGAPDAPGLSLYRLSLIHI